MSNTDSTGKIRRVAQTVTEHPVLSVIGLFAIGGTVAAIVDKRRNARIAENVELPTGAEDPKVTDKPSAVKNVDLINPDALGDTRNDDGPDPITEQIRP